MEDPWILVTSVLGCAWLALMILVIVLWIQLSSLKKKLAEMQNSPRMRVQKLKMKNDKNHAFHNPALSPDEELSRRGYSMYMSSDADVESGRHTDRHMDRHMDRPQERQTGGQFVDELIHELDSRQRQTSAPPFLLQSIQDNKMKTRNSMNPVANGAGRQSDTNPNFIY